MVGAAASEDTRMELEPQPVVTEAIETLVAEVISQAQDNIMEVEK